VQKLYGDILKAGAVLLLSGATTVMAQTASMDLTGTANGNVDYGVFLSPYTGLVNGVPTQIICDDFAHDSYIGETWTANASTVANLGSGVLYGQGNTKLYDEMAYLAYQLLTPPNPNYTNFNTQAAISFAIWDLGDPSGVASFPGGSGYSGFLNDSADSSGVAYWINQAQTNYTTLSNAQLAAVSVYTPITNNPADPIRCSGSICPSSPPQEFLAIHTAETSGIAILAANLLGFAAFAFLFRRRMASGK
jgi:hypothetical protein